MIKICFISEAYLGHPKASGGQYSTHILAKTLVKKGFEVHIVTSKYEGSKNIEIIDGVNIHRIFKERYGMLNKHKNILFSLYKNELFYIHGIRTMKEFLVKNNFNIIQAQNITTIPIVAYLSKMFKIPSATIINGTNLHQLQITRINKNNFLKNKLIKTYNFWTYVLLRFCLKKINLIFVTCNYLKKELEKTRISVDNVIYNLPPTRNINKENSRINNTPKDFVVFVTSFLSDNSKGYKSFLKIADLCPEINFVCVGKKDIKPFLKRNITYLGKLDQDKLIKIYQKSKIVLIPSTVPDALPRVGIESLLVGKPIVASNIGGIPELVIHNFNGYLVHMHNYSEFATKIKKIYNSPNLINKFSKNSKKLFNKRFNKDKIISKLIKNYSRILKCAEY